MQVHDKLKKLLTRVGWVGNASVRRFEKPYVCKP